MSVAWIKSFSDGLEHVGNRDGVGWFYAPKPWRWHRCKPETRAFFFDLQMVERCACGGLRYDGYGAWIERNSRRSH